MNDDNRIPVRVWDLPTRLFHWALVLLVTASLVTGEFDSILGATTLEWHKRSGLAILALLAFRLLWGFAGGTHARFASFLRGPRNVIGYAKGLLAGREQAEGAGHNPLGGWSVIAMLSALAVQVSTGLFLVDEDYGFEGPLARYASSAVADFLAEVHEVNYGVIGTLVALHLAAIAWYTVVKRQDLVRAMVTGVRRLAPGTEDSRGGGLATAAAIAIAAGAAVWALLGRA